MNLNVDVHYENQTDLEVNRDKQLVITIESLSNGQSYKYPNEDVAYFYNFPFNRLVFFRILAEPDLECTLCLNWLLQNAFVYEPISFLNTTSVYNCLIIPSNNDTTIEASTTDNFTIVNSTLIEITSEKSNTTDWTSELSTTTTTTIYEEATNESTINNNNLSTIVDAITDNETTTEVHTTNTSFDTTTTTTTIIFIVIFVTVFKKMLSCVFKYNFIVFFKYS